MIVRRSVHQITKNPPTGRSLTRIGTNRSDWCGNRWQRLGIDARIPRHVVGPHRRAGWPTPPRWRVVPDRDRELAERVDHVGRDVIARPPATGSRGRVGQIGAHHVGAQREGDLPGDPPHCLGRVERRAQRPAHRQQRLRLAQAQLLARQRVARSPPRACADVAEYGQVMAGHEPRRRVVLDGLGVAVGTDDPELSGLLPGGQKPPPRGIQVHAGSSRNSSSRRPTAPSSARPRRRQAAGLASTNSRASSTTSTASRAAARSASDG